VWVRAHVEALPGPGETATALRADDVVLVVLVVLVDLGVPRGVVSAVVAAAGRREARAVLSASPYAAVPNDALDGCDPCVVGERDAAALADA
jgi:hypothetical protein